MNFASSFIYSFNLTENSPMVVATSFCLDRNSQHFFVDTLPFDCLSANFMENNEYQGIISSTVTPSKIILLTDVTNATRNAIANIELLKSKGYEVFCVAVGDVSNVGWLKDVVSKPYESHYMHVAAYEQLNNVLPTLVDIVCNQSTKNGKHSPYQFRLLIVCSNF